MRLAVLLTFALLVAATPAGAAVRFERIDGVRSPGTPARYDKVGILKIGPAKARNVLVLNPGTSASAAYFAPLAHSIVAQTRGWQVWAVERRENLLEDHSVLDRAKAGQATPQQLFDYYLGYLRDASISRHMRLIPDAEVGYARRWGMATEVGDLRRVVLRAQRLGGKVVVGGHSLGGTIASAYATWDFGGRPGARGLAGLVLIDGASRIAPITAADARKRLADLGAGSPWLNFGGIGAPFAGLFNSTPLKRFADMFSGWGLKGLDGTAWYHPLRLTIDGGAVANGRANAAQKVLGVRATHGRDLPKRLRIYAFGAALGGTRVLASARDLARRSGIPRRRLVLVDRHSTYAHNDPSSASPARNAFLKRLVLFLARVAKG
jgi:pimeloyl-ACP methyl ester carboxylesterase